MAEVFTGWSLFLLVSHTCLFAANLSVHTGWQRFKMTVVVPFCSTVLVYITDELLTYSNRTPNFLIQHTAHQYMSRLWVPTIQLCFHEIQVGSSSLQLQCQLIYMLILQSLVQPSRPADFSNVRNWFTVFIRSSVWECYAYTTGNTATVNKIDQTFFIT